MGFGALVQSPVNLKFLQHRGKIVSFPLILQTLVDKNLSSNRRKYARWNCIEFSGISPAYIGVGYIIGPKLASLNFSGGLLAWGLFVPIITYFLAPNLLENWLVSNPGMTPTDGDWIAMATSVWRFIVRPIAIGGMLVSAGFTLFRMRKSLIAGISRSISDVKKAAAGEQVNERTEQDLNFKWIMIGILGTAVLTFFIYNHFAQNVGAALVATVVMIIAGFFFAAVSGYLVGTIGSSNNPISGLTLSTLLVAALLMVALGMTGQTGVAAVLGVAAVVCVSAAVAGEMLQDLKVGHILGGTPWKMEIGDLIGVGLASAVMFLPLIVLHQGDIYSGGTGFGGKNLPAPQEFDGITFARNCWRTNGILLSLSEC